ncbi:MDR family MFS transporter [Sphaerisporangium rubeum]|uniref:EmrB/QacA subfamily drug resistance transporter n=1 Tax=Sphaerisporangium rubeum TaxID=321317 RepID=A0A7X0M4B8_9ACTN|nr:EmrB/QacA subfamily drug resistance transporter [Sphaerisporangium rubeum]
MTTATTNDVGLRSERGPVLAAVMLCTGLIALDSTIIATAVPSMVTDLGGFSQFPWLFSIYLLTQAVTVPLYGKFADQFGRRPVLFFGIAVFLLASVLCGLAWSMPALIVFRALQGIGAGAIGPMSITIVGDMYSVEERARVQGYLASVWAMSAVVGPALGGVFADFLSWRWIFFINIPLGAIAAWTLARRFKEKVTRSSHKIDYLGATLLITGSSLIILGLLEGGVAWDWLSPPSLAIFTTGAILTTAFVLVERRAAEPILPLWVFGRRTLTGGNLVALSTGAILIGLTSYVPTYTEGVLGTGALLAGFALAALSIGWPLASTFSGRLYMRIGFRDTALIGSGILVAGTALCILLLTEHAKVWQVAAACFVAGVGLGLSASPVMVAVQSVVDWDRRGVVTATNLFCRSLGSAVGAALLGAIANATLTDRFTHPPAALAGKLPASLDATGLVLGAQGSAATSPTATYIRKALTEATHHVFLTLLVIAVLAVLALFLMPRRTEQLTFD